MGAVSYAVLGISLVHVAVQAVAIGVHWGYYVRQAGVDGCDICILFTQSGNA